jgi:predicted transcriptional regulator
MKRIFLLFFFLLLSCAPTRYIPKDSEPLSQAVYATSESIEKGRIDLADQYAKNAKLLVDPPKNPFTVKAIISKAKDKDVGKAVVVVPSYLTGMDVIVVGSEQYKKLLEIKENNAQLQIEYKNLQKEKEEVYKALRDQNEAKSQLLRDYDKVVLDLKDKQLALLKRNVIIGVMGLTIGLYVFLKVKKIIPF